MSEKKELDFLLNTDTPFLGITVFELSMNGQMTIDSYLNHTNGIGPDNLMNFTLCVRFNVNF